MTVEDISTAITEWTSWANLKDNSRFDIALLKIWIQFEKFMEDIFIQYAIGNPSETGYNPSLKLRFISVEHLNAFLREGNKTYIDYIAQIQKLSKHIFNDNHNPFDIVFTDANNYNYFNQIIAIRNYIAHESGEARTKMIRTCFGGDDSRFLEPQQYLLTKERSTGRTRYTIYTNAISNMASLLASPIN